MDEVDKVLQPTRDAVALVTALFDDDRSAETLLPLVNRLEESGGGLIYLAYLVRSIAEYGGELSGRQPQDLLRDVILQVESEAVENREALLRVCRTNPDLEP